jgi:C1A family cysteine protease
LENDFPYQGSEVACKEGLKPFRKASAWGYVANETGKNKPSRDAIKAAILKYGAVVTAIFSGSEFQKYESGIFKSCEDQPINHSVTIIGWDDVEGYWIVRNSWGKKWGEDGYVRMAYDCNHIGELVSYLSL